MAKLDGKKILIVEDDNFLSEMLAKKLSVEGAVISHAPDGEVALTMIRANTYDLVLLDILLPKKGGFEALTELRADEKTKDLAVIVLSNFGQKSDVEMGIKLGVKNFLVKALLSVDEIAEKVIESFK